MSWPAGQPGPRLVAVAKLLAAGAERSRHPRLAAAVAEAVQAVLYRAVCRTASAEQGAAAAGLFLRMHAVWLSLPRMLLPLEHELHCWCSGFVTACN